MPARPDDGRPPYYTARVVSGLVLIVTAAVLSVIDAYSVEFSLDSIVFGLILGTGAVLLGAEALPRRLRGDD